VAGFERLQRRGARGPVQAVPKQPAQLDHAYALGRDRHHHSGEARLRLPKLERVHRLATGTQLPGQFVQPRCAADSRGVAPELGPERRVDEQPLDQLARPVGLLLSG
jgi:hypothetical protein